MLIIASLRRREAPAALAGTQCEDRDARRERGRLEAPPEERSVCKNSMAAVRWLSLLGRILLLAVVARLTTASTPRGPTQECAPQSTALEVAERFESSMSLELRLPAKDCRIIRVKAPKDAILTVSATAATDVGSPQELIQSEDGVVTVASGWRHACGVVAVVVSVPLGMELDLSASTAPVVVPACSDGIDNDGDGLRDWPLDPGCDSPADGEDGDPRRRWRTNSTKLMAGSKT